MGYKKLVVSGNNVELYEYEKDLPRRTDRGSQTSPRGQNSAHGDVSERKRSVDYKKRQDSAYRASMAFRRLVASNLGQSEHPTLLTFTYAENQTDLREGYRDFSSFIQSMRRSYGKAFSYVAVPEFQARGAVHFHALFWGLPSKLLLEERETRTIAKIWGKGFLYVKPTDGNDKLSSYLAKYMAKSFVDSRLKNQKAYVASRNVRRPYLVSGSIDSMDILVAQFITVDNLAIRDQIYSSQWLGKGRYRLYEINQNNTK